MGETLEERIRRISKENFSLGKVEAYASDIVEIFDEKNKKISWLATVIESLIEKGWIDDYSFEDSSFNDFKKFIDETIEEYGRYEDGQT